MTLSRAFRKSISRLLIGVLLYAQFAVASYACPGLAGMSAMSEGQSTMVMNAVASMADNATTAEPTDMAPGCDQIDQNAPNLCAEHCRHGQQSVDTAQSPAVHAAVPTLLYSLPLEPQHSLGSGRSFPAADAGLDAAPEPPHAILHCVFRI